MITQKPIIAAKHLDLCEIEDCKFSNALPGESPICSFGLRHEGCIYFNPDMQHRLRLLASVEARLVVAKYGEDAYWAAMTRNDKIDLPSIDNIVEPVLENVGKITGKVYSFIHDGYEYTYHDGSIDHGISCPHCGHLRTEEITDYYGKDKVESRAACA